MASGRRPTSCHRSSGERTPPGKRQPMPTIAIGSAPARPRPPGVRRRARRPGVVAELARAGSRRARSGSGSRRSGWRQPQTGGRGRAGCAARRRSASRSPRSLEGPAGSTASASAWPSTAAACSRTRSSTARSRSASGQPGEPLQQAGPWLRRRPVAAGRPRWRSRGLGQVGEQRAGRGRGERGREDAPVDVGHRDRGARRGPARLEQGGEGERPAAARGMPPRRSALGVRVVRPCRSSSQGPQAREVAGRPRPGRCSARASRRRWRRRSCPGPAAPDAGGRRRTARTRRGRSVSSCRFGARPPWADHAGELRRGSAPSTTPSSRTPAVCTTARQRLVGRDVGQQGGQRVAVGDVAGGHGDVGAEAGQFRGQFRAPAASGPRRLSSSRCWAPLSASQRASRRAEGARCRR